MSSLERRGCRGAGSPLPYLPPLTFAALGRAAEPSTRARPARPRRRGCAAACPRAARRAARTRRGRAPRASATTVVSGGSSTRPMSRPSKPTTERSLGDPQPELPRGEVGARRDHVVVAEQRGELGVRAQQLERRLARGVEPEVGGRPRDRRPRRAGRPRDGAPRTSAGRCTDARCPIRRWPSSSRCRSAASAPPSASSRTDGCPRLSDSITTIGSRAGGARAAGRPRTAAARRRDRRAAPRPRRAPVAVVVRVDQRDRVAGGARGGLGAAQQPAEERVGDVRHDEDDRPRRAGLQRPRGGVRAVAELLGGGADRRLRARGDAARGLPGEDK